MHGHDVRVRHPRHRLPLAAEALAQADAFLAWTPKAEPKTEADRRVLAAESRSAPIVKYASWSPDSAHVVYGSWTNQLQADVWRMTATGAGWSGASGSSARTGEAEGEPEKDEPELSPSPNRSVRPSREPP